MPLRPPRPLPRPAGPRRSALVGLAGVAAATLVLAACSGAAPEPSGPPPAPDTAVAAEPRELVIVLPPRATLAEAEHARVRLLVERVLETELAPAARRVVTLLEPADAASQLDAVERAVRRVGDRGSVCVLGAEMRDALAPLLALYPATRACLLPASVLEDDPLVVADVDLDVLGRALGTAARAAAGEGTVVVLAGGDAMLDRRWRTGVLEAALVAVGQSALPGPVLAVRSADELLTLLEDQAALVAQGVEPGSPRALELLEDTGIGGLGVDALPPAIALPRVGAVVLDASPEAALVVGVLADEGVRVLAPRSLVLAADAADDAVVLLWRVRWDVPLTGLVRRLVDGGGGPPVTEDVLALEPGPAYAGP